MPPKVKIVLDKNYKESHSRHNTSTAATAVSRKSVRMASSTEGSKTSLMRKLSAAASARRVSTEAPSLSKAAVGPPPTKDKRQNRSAPASDAEKTSSTKKRFRKTKEADKLRVRLTPIEDYEKKLIFPSEATGRVVARLERMMGSDKVNLLDYDWIEELIYHLEEEESDVFSKRIAEREAKERERYRQLAIDGLMEPTADMTDIYRHPVYIMNQVMKRLEKFDYNALINPKIKLPPLTLMDPFDHDDSGRIFKRFPGHKNIYDAKSRLTVKRGSSSATNPTYFIARSSEDHDQEPRDLTRDLSP